MRKFTDEEVDVEAVTRSHDPTIQRTHETVSAAQAQFIADQLCNREQVLTAQTAQKTMDTCTSTKVIDVAVMIQRHVPVVTERHVPVMMQRQARTMKIVQRTTSATAVP